MTDSILQSFLDKRFIKTDESENIANLNKAVAELQKRLSKNKEKIITYTLVALDPTISDDEPIVQEVEALIIKKWSAFRNSVAKTKDIPITYVQAVILEALNNLSKDENLAAIIWHTGCNIISHYKLAGQEEVLTHFLLEIGNKVEEVARNNWSILENAKIDAIAPIELTLPKVSQGRVGEAELQGHLIAAAVHSPWAPQAGGGENPSPQSTGNFHWPKFFAERAAKGLSEVINAALSTQNNSLKSISDSIQESIGSYLANLKPHLEQVSSSILRSSQSLNKRSDLIWWKQALYSHRLDSGYRALDPLALAMSMAVDLADNVSPIHPKSVDFFLKEALRDVLSDETDKEVAVTELLEQLQQLSDAEKQLLEDLCNESESRKSLGACMADMMKKKMNADEFFKRTGLVKRAKISLGELTVWLFHDLQASTLANTK
ncbi:MAG TPA: GTPase-associated system all-helical protein GASH [Anaerolineae bacterium]|nr:GTPase-associated system all-helical protein GASH [Anaerolineae bacterium]